MSVKPHIAEGKMRTTILASLVIALISATGAAGRERAFRTADPAAAPPVRVYNLCTFKALQMSGYRATAGEKKICYFDCDGAQAAIMVGGGKHCSQDQAVLIHGI